MQIMLNPMHSVSRHTWVWVYGLGFGHTASSNFDCPGKGDTIPSLLKTCVTTLPTGQMCQLCCSCNCYSSISFKAWHVETHCHLRRKIQGGVGGAQSLKTELFCVMDTSSEGVLYSQFSSKQDCQSMFAKVQYT